MNCDEYKFFLKQQLRKVTKNTPDLQWTPEYIIWLILGETIETFQNRFRLVPIEFGKKLRSTTSKLELKVSSFFIDFDSDIPCNIPCNNLAEFSADNTTARRNWYEKHCLKSLFEHGKFVLEFRVLLNFGDRTNTGKLITASIESSNLSSKKMKTNSPGISQCSYYLISSRGDCSS